LELSFKYLSYYVVIQRFISRLVAVLESDSSGDVIENDQPSINDEKEDESDANNDTQEDAEDSSNNADIKVENNENEDDEKEDEEDEKEDEEDEDDKSDEADGGGNTPIDPIVTTPSAGRLLAAQCAQCHGTDGRGKSFDKLAGEDLFEKLLEMHGKNKLDLMYLQARGYTQEQLGLISDYYSNLPEKQGGEK